jgi:hypothetical protein
MTAATAIVPLDVALRSASMLALCGILVRADGATRGGASPCRDRSRYPARLCRAEMTVVRHLRSGDDRAARERRRAAQRHGNACSVSRPSRGSATKLREAPKETRRAPAGKSTLRSHGLPALETVVTRDATRDACRSSHPHRIGGCRDHGFHEEQRQRVWVRRLRDGDSREVPGATRHDRPAWVSRSTRWGTARITAISPLVSSTHASTVCNGSDGVIRPGACATQLSLISAAHRWMWGAIGR